MKTRASAKTLSLFGEAPPPSRPAPPPRDPVTRVADVALDLPIDTAFTYAIPSALEREVQAGVRVLCPFGSGKKIGLVVEVRAPSDHDLALGGRLRALSAVVDSAPVLPSELLAFLREVARYYLSPLGEVVGLALPAIERAQLNRLRARGEREVLTTKIAPAHVERIARRTMTELPESTRLGPKARAILDRIEASEVSIATLAETWPDAATVARTLAKKGFVAIDERPTSRAAFEDVSIRDRAPTLNEEQRVALTAIDAAIDAHAPQAFLLHGVTGSGKTEVYLHAIATALAKGRGALMLVPEIALTPQLVARFRARFGDEVAVVHSALDPSARHAMWKRLHAGELRVAIGARSALFAPVPAIGLVIVDEEHDGSFKQEEGVRYHARDCALLRAHRASAVCVLGSATPSLESVEGARRGRLTLLRLEQRARAQPMPTVKTLDLRHLGPGPSGSRLITLPLHRALEATLAANEQAILFLNRRGFAPSVRCEACGDLKRCPDCDVALTLHIRKGTRTRRRGDVEITEEVPAGLRCHYCDRLEPEPKRCGKCNGQMILDGVGTERLEELLAKSFPKARVARLDRDVASGREVEAILKRVRDREVDILVGTQMVTKGHDLPNVTLVGVVNADAALSMPDFRASERTFQLLVQVAGRAGRGDAPGSVFIQTRSTEHIAIACALQHDVVKFQELELEDRRELGYPPFSRLALIRLDGLDDARTQAVAAAIAARAEEACKVANGDVEVRGPTPAPMPRVRNRFRHRVLLRGERGAVRSVARVVASMIATLPRDVRVVIDIDPLSMM